MTKITGLLVKGAFLLMLILLATITTTLQRMDKNESIGPVPQFLAWSQGGKSGTENKGEVEGADVEVSSQEQKTEEGQVKNEKENERALGGSTDVKAKVTDPTLSPNPTSSPIASATVTSLPAVNPTSIPNLSNPTNQCVASGGSIASFPNSCGDSCALAQRTGEIYCLDVMTDSCDCGPTMCWNGTECVENPNGIGDQEPIDPPKPICGNGICELGEDGVNECPVCNENEVCPLRACIIYPSVCPEDCDKQ